MSNNRNQNQNNRPAPAQAQQEATVPPVDASELEARAKAAESSRDALQAELDKQSREMNSLRAERDRMLAASQNSASVEELERTIKGMRAGYATTKKLLTWLIKTYSMHRLEVMLYDLADDRSDNNEFQCSPEEMDKICDLLKSKMDSHYAGIVESYRKQVVELAETTITRRQVKEATLAATVDQVETVAS